MRAEGIARFEATSLKTLPWPTASRQQAVDVFTASLEVYTEDQSPSDYADAQEGLGWAEANLGFRTKDRELILHGRDAMKEALRIYQDYNGAEDYYKDRLAKIDKMLKSVM